jgi:zinc and cadmium transporter
VTGAQGISSVTLFLVLLFSLLGGAISVLLAATVLAVKRETVERALPRLIAFSTGTLLGSALLGMLPHAAEDLEGVPLFRTVLLSLGGFYVLEKALVWRHCHAHDCEVHAHSGPLLLLGDAVHNFVDGIVIAGAFLTSAPLGIATALSTIAHEIPQELGEFIVYLKQGYSRGRALALNAATSATTLVGAGLGYFYFSNVRQAGAYFLSIAAGGFLYVALADLIPSQRGRTHPKESAADLALILLGIAIVALITSGHRH